MSPPPWRYGFSPTLKAIYVIRYLLFSGGVAVAAAMVQRAAFGAQPPTLGLLIGLAVGLVLFRSQLRPLGYPALLLSRDALYVVRRKAFVTLPWTAIRSVAQEGEEVALSLDPPLPLPEGSTARFALRPAQLSVPAPRLSAELRAVVEDPRARAQLPDDAALRQRANLR